MSYLEELELQFRDEDRPNWPGYNGKLECRALQHSDAAMLIPVIKSDKGNLSTFLGKFYKHKDWNLKSAQGMVSNLLRQGWPAMTWLFFIGNHPIGLVSTARDERFDECQLVISVFSQHQGKGFGQAMTKTILKITEEVFGFQRTWWHVDAANFASIHVAQNCGFQLFDTYDTGLLTKETTGYYYRFVKERPEGLPPGLLQGSPIDYWWRAKDPELLKMVIEAENNQELSAIGD